MRGETRPVRSNPDLVAEVKERIANGTGPKEAVAEAVQKTDGT